MSKHLCRHGVCESPVDNPDDRCATHAGAVDQPRTKATYWAPVADNPAAQVPNTQGLDLFEVYEATGALLLVTSDATLAELQPGDVMVRRAWATSAEIKAVRHG